MEKVAVEEWKEGKVKRSKVLRKGEKMVTHESRRETGGEEGINNCLRRAVVGKQGKEEGREGRNKKRKGGKEQLVGE